MAKSNTIQIKLVSSAETGYFYVTKKNVRNTTGKLEIPGNISIIALPAKCPELNPVTCSPEM